MTGGGGGDGGGLAGDESSVGITDKSTLNGGGSEVSGISVRVAQVTRIAIVATDAVAGVSDDGMTSVEGGCGKRDGDKSEKNLQMRDDMAVVKD